MNTTIIVVIIQILYQSTLEFPKCERQPLLYPLEKPRIMLLFQLVVIVFKHSVKSLEFPKYERFRGILYSVKQIILVISYIAKVAIL